MIGLTNCTTVTFKVINERKKWSTVEKTNDSPWQNADVCRSHCRRNIKRSLVSLWQFFLPTYCLGKLKNSEIASVFYCRRTEYLNFKGWLWLKHYFHFNPSRPNPGQKEKIKLNFYFHTSLWCLKRFYEGLKGFHKTFWDTTKKCEKKKLT